MIIKFPLETETCSLELDNLQWKTQAGTFARGEARDSRGKVIPVFLKRYSNQSQAVGHGLLYGSIYRKIPCTPDFYAYIENSGYRYYISQFMNGTSTFETMTGNIRLPHNKLLTHRRITTLLNNLRAALEEINKREYFHPDVCYKNILIDPEPEGDRILLIDLDSCIPYHSNRLVTAINCDQTWWLLFHERKLADYRFLNPSMLVMMAMVLYFAMTQAENYSGSQIVNVKKDLDARPETQRNLLSVMDKQDPGLLCSTYHRPNGSENAKRVLNVWLEITKNFHPGKVPDWRKVSLFCNSMAHFCRPN